MKIYGVVGHPVLHSLGPAMHNAAFKAKGIEAEYRIFDISSEDPEALAHFCYELELNNIGGFSVTIPYKQAIMAYLDYYNPLAKAVGAVNTVSIERDKKHNGPVLIGYNTDSGGAIKALEEKITLAGKKALVLGAGGAGRAIAYALKRAQAEIYLFNRDAAKAEALAREFGVNSIDYSQIKKDSHFDLIVNATSVGSGPNTTESLLHAEQIEEGAVVMDIVTYPLKTQLLKEAEKAGALILTGERMLLHQAAAQFKIWFGEEAPVAAMEKALKEALKRRKKFDWN